MKNSAIDFVRRLTAAYPRNRIPADTGELYVSELQRLGLRDSEYDRLFDSVVSENPEFMPTLAVVLKAANQIISNRHVSDSLGWCYFDIGRYTYAIRVYCENGEWRVYPLRYDGRAGAEYAQKRVGERVQIPDGATNARIVPDRIYIEPSRQRVDIQIPDLSMRR